MSSPCALDFSGAKAPVIFPRFNPAHQSRWVKCILRTLRTLGKNFLLAGALSTRAGCACSGDSHPSAKTCLAWAFEPGVVIDRSGSRGAHWVSDRGGRDQSSELDSI